MADDIDIASCMEQDFVERAIEANRKTLVKMKPTGFCRNCEAELKNQKAIFCNPDCEREFNWFIRRSNTQRYEGAV